MVKDSGIAGSKVTLPWSKWLKFKEPKYSIDSLAHLEDVATKDRIASIHLAFLKSSIEPLKSKSLPQWKSILALGPFTEMRYPKKSIPIIAVANYKKPFRHLYALSWAFSNSFSEFGILPDIYIIPEKSKQYLQEVDHPMWNKTLSNSIAIFYGGRNA